MKNTELPTELQSKVDDLSLKAIHYHAIGDTAKMHACRGEIRRIYADFTGDYSRL